MNAPGRNILQRVLQNRSFFVGKLIQALLALACAVALIAALHQNTLLLTALLGSATSIILIRSRHQPADLIPFIVGALLGPGMEIIVIRFGAWSYAHPSVAGIPVWLPMLWGLTAFFLMKISGLLQELVWSKKDEGILLPVGVPFDDVQPNGKQDPISDKHEGEDKGDRASCNVRSELDVSAFGTDVSEDRNASDKDRKEELDELCHVIEEHRPKFCVHRAAEAVVETHGNQSGEEDIEVQNAREQEYRTSGGWSEYRPAARYCEPNEHFPAERQRRNSDYSVDGTGNRDDQPCVPGREGRSLATSTVADKHPAATKNDCVARSQPKDEKQCVQWIPNHLSTPVLSECPVADTKLV
jgi:hypothetical protein